MIPYQLDAKVAQLVEHSSEKAGVTGSIPVLGTSNIPHLDHRWGIRMCKPYVIY